MRDIKELANDSFNYWMENCTPEQMALGAPEAKEPTTKREVIILMTAFFHADVNKDYLLDKEEFVAFVKELMRSSVARGNFVDDREEMASKRFALANSITPDIDGVSLPDYLIFNRIRTRI